MTIADKLRKVLSTKNALKQALIDKGVEVSDTDDFASYVGKIESITGGGGASIPMGVAFWIDGQMNMRDGSKNTSVLAMQNLCWADNGQGTTGDREYLQQSGNVWDGNFLTLGNYGYYPYIYTAGGLSVEAYIKFTKEITTNISVLSTGSAGGWYLGSFEARTMLFLANLGGTYIRLDDPTVLEIGKPYYVVATYKANDTITLTVIDENGNKTTTSTAFAGTMKRNRVNMGFGTQASTGTSLNDARYNGLSVGMARVWTRALTDEEIQANYEETKKRFKE